MLDVLNSFVSWFLRILPTAMPILQASAATAVTITAICNLVRWFRRSHHQQASLQSTHAPIRQQQRLLQDRRQSGRRQLPMQTQPPTVRSKKVYYRSKMDDKKISKQKKDVQLPPEEI